MRREPPHPPPVEAVLKICLRALDWVVRHAMGVRELCGEPDCLLRIRRVRWPREVFLPSGQAIPKGAWVLDLHLWNEHLPAFPRGGPDLVWAARGWRMLQRSFERLARDLLQSPTEKKAIALVGVLSLPVVNGRVRGESLLRRLGFTLRPRRARLGRFGEFWENLYARWVLWAFNARRARNLEGQLVRFEAWMSTEEFIARYGTPSGRFVSIRRGTAGSS